MKKIRMIVCSVLIVTLVLLSAATGCANWDCAFGGGNTVPIEQTEPTDNIGEDLTQDADIENGEATDDTGETTDAQEGGTEEGEAVTIVTTTQSTTTEAKPTAETTVKPTATTTAKPTTTTAVKPTTTTTKKPTTTTTTTTTAAKPTTTTTKKPTTTTTTTTTTTKKPTTTTTTTTAKPTTTTTTAPASEGWESDAAMKEVQASVKSYAKSIGMGWNSGLNASNSTWGSHTQFVTGDAFPTKDSFVNRLNSNIDYCTTPTALQHPMLLPRRRLSFGSSRRDTVRFRAEETTTKSTLRVLPTSMQVSRIRRQSLYTTLS